MKIIQAQKGTFNEKNETINMKSKAIGSSRQGLYSGLRI